MHDDENQAWTKVGMQLALKYQVKNIVCKQVPTAVKVEFVGVGTYNPAPTGDDGAWSVSLPPQPASINHSSVITDGTAVITLVDIALGDVVLCTGQSNVTGLQPNPNPKPNPNSNPNLNSNFNCNPNPNSHPADGILTECSHER